MNEHQFLLCLSLEAFPLKYVSTFSSGVREACIYMAAR